MKNPTIAKLLKKYHIRPNKKLGQNFLADGNIINKLTDTLEIYPDEDVLEIASGLGLISYNLSKQALEVVAIEKDKRLINISRKEFGGAHNLKFIEGDLLDIDLPHVLADYHLPMKLIGNIPYNISSKIIFKILENHSLFQFAVLTVQKEVACRMVAKPGSKDYGLLAIFIQTEAECQKLFNIGPGAFRPEPEVTSSVVRMVFPKKPRYLLHKPALYKSIVKEAFRQRRKKIKNNLKKLLKNNRIKPWAHAQIDPEARPEEISIPQYVALANFLAPLL